MVRVFGNGILLLTLPDGTNDGIQKGFFLHDGTSECPNLMDDMVDVHLGHPSGKFFNTRISFRPVYDHID